MPIPPSCHAALAGATVILNLSASNITIAKDEYRHSLVSNQSARCLAGYLYTAAGTGESTTDLAWDGHAMVYENGDLIAESEAVPLRIATRDGGAGSGTDHAGANAPEQLRPEHAAASRRTAPVPKRFSFIPSFRTRDVCCRSGRYDRFPYVPSDPTLRDRRCYEAYNIQVQGLVQRLKSSGVSKIVIGVSGGLDSTHALIVAARAMDVLKFPRANILAYTMPGLRHQRSTRWQTPPL